MKTTEMRVLANKKDQQHGATAKAKKKTEKNTAIRWVSVNWRRVCAVVIGVGLLSGSYWGGTQLLDTLDQPLEEVQVRGEFEHLDVETIVQLVQRRVDAGLVAVDLLEVQQWLLKQPWIAQVSVRRKWPNLLQIDLVERSPVARWNLDALITANGEVFKPKENLARYQLPRLAGADESRKQVLQQYGWLSEQLKEEGLEIIELKKEQRGAWSVKLAEGPRVELGNGDLRDKVQRFKGLYKKALNKRLDAIEKIDLRYTHGAAVQWKVGAQEKQEIKQVATGKVSALGEKLRVSNTRSTA